MKKYMALILSLVLCMGLMTNTAFATSETSNGEFNIYHEGWDVLRITNQHRMSIGLNPLSTYKALQETANLRAIEVTQVFSHSRPDGSSCQSAYNQCGVGGYYTLGENIAAGQCSPAEVVASWLDSPGHRENIETSEYTHMSAGYALSSNGYGNAWTQNFIGGSCSVSSVYLSCDAVYYTPGQNLDDILTAGDVQMMAYCSTHRDCYLPVIAAMCSGYNPTVKGVQTITVSYKNKTVELELVPAPTPHNFTDVQKTDWYNDAVQWAVDAGITCGTSATTFSPKAPCTNIQILTFLWRACGSDVVDVTTPFVVNGVEDYVNAANWAYKYGVIDSTFNPDAPCTRANAVYYIWASIGNKLMADFHFVDIPADAYYAPAVSWAIANNVTNGTSATTFSPDKVCDRSEIVTFLYRYALTCYDQMQNQ